MKIRLIIGLYLGLIGCRLPAALGFQQPSQPALTNYDVRAASQPAAPDANQELAAAALKARVPALRFEKDKLLGVPRLVSASRGFLTGPNGRGKAVTPG